MPPREIPTQTNWETQKDTYNVFPQDHSQIFIAMNDNTNILFWISFVGAMFFVIYGIYATISLKQFKSSNMSESQNIITYMTAVMTIIFIVLSAISHNNKTIINHTHTPEPIIEEYTPFGKIIIHDTTTNNDTITLYKKIEK